MSISKLRGKSAIVQNNENNKLMKPYVPATTSLLKIEPFVPSFSTRFRKPIYRSYSTLSSTYFKRVTDHKHRPSRHPERSILVQHQQRSKSSLSSSKSTQNGVYRINRPLDDQEKLPDRINFDRRGLTAIPIFENEQNLRLLSLQHNLINIFHVPDDTGRKSPNDTDASDIVKSPVDLETTTLKPTRNGMVLKSTLSVSSPLSGPPTSNFNLIVPGTIASTTIISSSSNTLSPNSTSLMRNSFVKKSILLHAQQKYSLKKSKSFINQYSQHLNNLKHNIQKCSLLSKTNNLSSFGSDLNNPQAPLVATTILDVDTEKNGIDDIQSLKVKNNQLNPTYGSIFQNLVFLDLYDNQIEKISNLDGLKSLTVLLLGKNRISEISGLVSLRNTLRVLDLHGNKIVNISNRISCLQELKSLNLAGNQIRQINQTDFAGLTNLKELNLKRNRIKRVFGFNHLTSLERLWLCHNDIHRVEEMCSIADATNLQEVTIENNPVSLAGDCVSFLVSYLPNLIMLSQMPITDQVRNAAMAWRKSKELSNGTNSTLTCVINSLIRREEVISNARTNWELLRSQQMLTPNKALPCKLSSPSMVLQSTAVEPVKEPPPPQEIEKALKTNSIAAKPKTPKICPEKKRQQKFERADSEFHEFFRLPPIDGQQRPDSKSPSEKTNSSGSSLGPNVDSSSSCYTSDDNDETAAQKSCNPEPIAIRVPHVKEQTALESEDNFDDSLSKINSKDTQIIEECLISLTTVSKENDAITIVTQTDANTIVDTVISEPLTPQPPLLPSPKKQTENFGNDSTNSQSDRNSNLSAVSLKSESELSAPQVNHIEKSTRMTRGVNSTTRRYGTLVRSQTARSRITTISSNSGNPSATTNNSTVTGAVSANNTSSGATAAPLSSTTAAIASSKPSKPIVEREREREQGGDYLIEICGRYLNVYGLGALRFIDKQWNAQKANDVHTLNFSYVNFNSIAGVLCRIKCRFSNAESFVFRETNINSLGQLNALAELQGITSLVIDLEGNSICEKNWRLYAIYRLSHWGLKTINGIEITENEIEQAHCEYLGLSDLVLWSLPETLLQPLLARLRLEESCTASKLSAKDWLMKADQSLKVVVGKEALQWKKPTAAVSALPNTNSSSVSDESNLRSRGTSQLTVMIENTCNAVEKLQSLETLWPSLLLDIVRNTLLDYSQLEVYVKNLMADVMK